MRKLIFGILIFTMISSCDKDSEETPTPATKTKKEMFTQKTWVYDELFLNYNSASTTVAYKRGKPVNAQNFDAVSVKFNADGSYSETLQNGTTMLGTWEFVNGESQVKITNSLGVYTTNMVKLTEETYVWFDPNTSGGIYAKLLHP